MLSDERERSAVGVPVASLRTALIRTGSGIVRSRVLVPARGGDTRLAISHRSRPLSLRLAWVLTLTLTLLHLSCKSHACERGQKVCGARRSARIGVKIGREMTAGDASA